MHWCCSLCNAACLTQWSLRGELKYHQCRCSSEDATSTVNKPTSKNIMQRQILFSLSLCHYIITACLSAHFVSPAEVSLITHKPQPSWPVASSLPWRSSAQKTYHNLLYWKHNDGWNSWQATITTTHSWQDTTFAGRENLYIGPLSKRD